MPSHNPSLIDLNEVCMSQNTFKMFVFAVGRDTRQTVVFFYSPKMKKSFTFSFFPVFLTLIYLFILTNCQVTLNSIHHETRRMKYYLH